MLEQTFRLLLNVLEQSSRLLQLKQKILSFKLATEYTNLFFITAKLDRNTNLKGYRLFVVFAVIVIVVISCSIFTQIGMASSKAPEPIVSEWLNKDPGPLMNMRGKVIVIDFFQMWCPGCNNFSVPLMFQLEEKYKGRNDVVFLSIHTVFEGHAYQTPDDLKDYVAEKGIKHPVGIDEYGPDSYVPITMTKYGTGGTPCITIIDKKGYIRFQKLGGFGPDIAVKLIDQLIDE